MQTLLLQKASLKHNPRAINAAIDMFGVVGQADAFDLGAALDYHRRSFDFEILDHRYRIAILQLGAVAIYGLLGRCIVAIALCPFVLALHAYV